jgi:phage portal protein BeeE
MMKLNPFSKKVPALKNKATNPAPVAKSFTIPAGFLTGSSVDGRLSAKQAIQYYDKAAPVAIAVDWINDEFKNLSLVMMDETDQSIEKDSDLLKFLKQPNQDSTQEDFLENLGATYLLANEVYIIATGNVNKEPAELMIISPTDVTTFIGSDDFLSRIDVQRGGNVKEVYTRDVNFRFFNKEQNKEIWQIKGFSTINNQLSSSGSVLSSSASSNRGRSKLRSVRREIEQYIAIATNNLAILDNGMRPSGTIETPDGEVLTDEQFEAIREQVVNFYSGGQNAGNVLILDNGLTFNPIASSVKDMDFPVLTRTTTITIFNRYKVPLPLVTPENMTLANMETAKLNLYDNTVLPLGARMFRELTNFLGPRFGIGEDEVIAADLSQISALQIRRNQELKLKKDLNVLSTDELRDEIGRDKVKGGDVIYQASNLVPIGTAPLAPVTPTTGVAASSPDPIERKEFFKIMKQQKFEYTDAELEKMADDEGLV